MKVLDLFSGIGGFSLGLERAGMETIAFCEIDKKCQLVIKKHWAGIPVYGDIKKLTWEKLKNNGIEKPDVICGGFPCQGFSVAGKQRGFEDERTALWFEYRRLIGEIRPDFVIVENSRNMLSGKRGTWFSQFLTSLAEIGYDAEWNIISAAGVGAPHLRERTWILAYPNVERTQIQVKREFTIKQLPWGPGKTSANSNSKRKPQQEGIKQDIGGRTSDFCKEIPDSDEFNGIDRRFRTSPLPLIKAANLRASEFWSTEPAVGRVVDGFPGRVDQLKQLGNTVVPQIPELIGNAILKQIRRL